MSSIVVSGDTSGAVTLSAPAVAGTVTVTLPSASGTMAVLPTATGVLAESAGGTGTTTGYYGFKNRIINGAMVIDQRNAGNTVNNTTAGLYTLDRWLIYGSVSAKFRVAQSGMPAVNSAGFSYCIQIYSLANTTVSASDIYVLSQYIEGYNIADMLWGTASAKSFTVSFWVYSTLTGTFGGYVKGGSTYTYPFTYTVSSANTWQQVSVTIPGQTAGTWNTTNGIGFTVGFSFGTGSTYTAAANSWTGGDYYGATGQTQFVSTSAATMYITGVQLEKGSTATAFDYRDYGREMIMCQRYYTQFGLEQASSSLSQLGVAYQATTAVFPYILPVKMRSQPTVSASTTELVEWQTLNTYTPTTYTLPTAQQATQSPLIAINISPSSMTAGRVYTLRATSTAGYIAFISEL